MHHHRHWRRHRRSRGGFRGWGDLGRGRFFGPGEVRLALLSLLSEGPRHGYELMKELEGRSGGVYRASAGTVYPTLQQLEDEGLATSEPREGKRVYELTDAGRRELEQETEAVERIWRRAEAWGEWEHAGSPEAWEVARPAMRLVKSALRAVARSGGSSERIEQVRTLLDSTRRELDRLAESSRP
jgi:DNA-binding PadR family transcriptional regulator